MSRRAYLASLIGLLLITQCLAQASISLKPLPSACTKACIQPAVQPQCPVICPNSCTFVVKDPCCPSILTGVCDNSTSGSSTDTSPAMTSTNAGSAIPTATTSISSVGSASSVMSSTPSSSLSAGSSPSPTPAKSSSVSVAGNLVEAKYAFLAFMFTLLFLF